jgi:hypothetical protein
MARLEEFHENRDELHVDDGLNTKIGLARDLNFFEDLDLGRASQ